MLLIWMRVPNKDIGELAYDRLDRTREIGLKYKYDTYLICMGLGPSISSVIAKSLSYSGPSYACSPVQFTGNSSYHCNHGNWW